jgi:hypothetical protein
LYAIVAGLVLAAIAFAGFVSYEREIGRKDALLNDARKQVDSLTKLSRQIEVRFQTDTVRLRHLVSRTDTLRDSVLVHLTDTVRVKELIFAQDTTIKVCRSTLSECALGWQTERKRADALQTEVRALAGHQSTFMGTVGKVALGVGIGYLARAALKP